LFILNAGFLHRSIHQFTQNMTNPLFISRNQFVMMVLGLLTVLFHFPAKGQTITTHPILPTDATLVTITFDATGTELQDYTGDVYAHTGVTIEGAANLADNGRWKYVVANWDTNIAKAKFTRTAPNTYTLELGPTLRQYYAVPTALTITEICLVVRASDRSRQTRPDFFIPLAQPGLAVSITSPSAPRPIYQLGETATISAIANHATSIKLFIDDTEVAEKTSANPATLELTHQHLTTSLGRKNFKLVAREADKETIEIEGYFFVRGASPVAALPQDVVPGPNYLDNSSVTLVLHDPPALKNNVFVIGDFNDWELTEEHFMNRTPDGKYYWTNITDLTPDTEYGYQYYIDGELTLADPYTHKVLDPSTDMQIISEGRYPGLILYPFGKTTNPASVIQPGRTPFQWQVTDFTPPPVEDLVIYEILVRDFLNNNTYQGLKDTLHYLKRLGINAIQLMPITNFEGNLSWGYNPSFFFAADKFYGPRRELKKLIDEAHSLGMAVILDMVWNHSFSQSPLLQMYFDSNNNRPSNDNPWYSDPIFANPGMNFGYKFDHGSSYFVEFMDRANTYWLTEFKVDGFRFDLTKGFTTNFKGSNDEWGSNYDQKRVDNLVRMYNQIKSVNPNAYVILEHLASNTEEQVLANAGMLLWGNMNHNYNEATMGWHESNKSNLAWGSYKARNWNAPHLITYMESHDEERLMVKNLKWGNSSNNYNIKELTTALRRVEQAAVFFFTIPGPKMIWQFGELGYDVSIDLNGRTGTKPIRWNYYDDWRRKHLHDVFAALIDLKKENDVFRSADFSLSTAAELKRIHLNHTSNQVTILGNFDVVEKNINPHFQQTGTWHEFFSRETLQVTDVNATITMQPGEYRIYSTVAFPDPNLTVSTPPEFTQSNKSVRVFPNPSENGFTFAMETNSKWNLRIMNIQGQTIVYQNNLFGPANNQFYWNSHTLEGNKAAAGIYFYNLYNNSESISGKIMIK